MPQGYHEEADPRTNKAPKHQEAASDSSWKELSDAVVMPLVEDPGQPRKMKGSLAMIDPIKQILDIRKKYEVKHSFIREALQNIDRSTEEEGHNRDPNVDIVITEDELTVYDNAGGITKEKLDKLFDFGISGWEGGAVKENPFGQGFLSFIILFNRVEVFSNNVHAIFDMEDILTKKEEKVFNLNEAYDYETTRSRDTFGRGEFTVICSKPTEYWDPDTAIKMAKISGESLSFKTLTINGERVSMESFDAPYGAVDISKYNSDGEKVIDGWVEPTGDMSEHPYAYYHRKIVGYFSALPGMGGKINILNDRYGEPVENRNNWQESTKNRGIKLTTKHIKALIKDFILDIFKHGSDETIERYQGFRGVYVSYNDYRYIMNFALIGNNTTKSIADDIKRENPDISDDAFYEEIQTRMSSKSSLTDSAEKTIRTEGEIAEDYNKKEVKIQERRREIIEEKVEADHVEAEFLEEEEKALSEEELELRKHEEQDRKIEEDRNKRLKEGTLKLADINKTTFWVRVVEITTFLEQMKEAEYRGYQVAIAYNSVQEEVFTKESVGADEKSSDIYFEGEVKSKNVFLHIGYFKYVSTYKVKMKKIGPKNKEEARIEWVINTFINSVPEFEKVDFHIADYEFKTEMTIPGTTIKKSEKTTAIAYAEGNDVYMMREMGYCDSNAGETTGIYGAKSLKPYLKYNDFPLENKTIGWGDIALFLRVINLIAHEMAHSIYHTTDNTQEHFEAMGKIIALFNNVITEHQGKTTLGDAKDMGVKNRRALGVEKGDTVAITYFTGTDVEMEESEIKPRAAKKDKTFKVGDYLLHNDLAMEVSSIQDDFYTVKYYDPYSDGYAYDFIDIPMSEAVEFPYKKGRLYNDLEYDRGIFIMDILNNISDNGIRMMEFRDYNESSSKDYRIIPTSQAIKFKTEIFNKKEQAEFVHRISLELIDKYMNDYGPTSIPELVDYFRHILPINFQTIQYIIDKKYADKYEKTGNKALEGGEEYYFRS